jgi:hypothetical protein
MKGKHSLKKKGLSLSQAQSISNLCNQRSIEIDREINAVNNFTREIKMPSGEMLVQVKGCSFPGDIKQLIEKKGKLHAVQAFLMENIKAKDELLREASNSYFDEDAYGIEVPKCPNYITPKTTELVGEEYGWQQLTEAEYQEYLEAEAMAAHAGQFIHKGGKLDKLRNELSTEELLQWISIQDGVKSPVILTPHHHSSQLMVIHEQISGLHRAYEQRVNYFKAKVKNIVNDKNAEINSENAKLTEDANRENNALRTQYRAETDNYLAEVKKVQYEFESGKEKMVKEISQLRIEIPERFKELVDEILETLQ